MKKYVSFVEKLNKATMLLGVLLLVFAVVLTFVQVLTRNLLSFSFSWAEETTRYVIIFAVYLAAGQAFYIDANATVDMVYNTLPKKLQYIINYIFYVLIAAFLLAMGYYGYVLVSRNLTTWCASVHIPWAVPFSALILGAVNMLLQVPAKCYKNYLKMKEA